MARLKIIRGMVIMVAVSTAENQSAAGKVDYEVLVVGSGFAGIGAGIKLNKIGILN
jgi:heterodisulfide reductase subunit A-like polyferredoxin